MNAATETAPPPRTDERPEQSNRVGAAAADVIKIKVSYGTSHHDVTLPPRSTFGYLKEVLAPEVGLEPFEQRLFFRGREKGDKEALSTAGVKNLSKLLLMEHPESKERKIEEMKKQDEISKACETVAEVRAEVDKLSQKVVASIAASVDGRMKVDDKDFVFLTEMLMVQLLRLDTIDAQGEAKVQRKTEVRRVQSYVDTLDVLKARNSNPSNVVAGTAEGEKFDSEVGVWSSLAPLPSPANTNEEWEKFDQ
ncbi:BAG family molecular chaperone regulator 4-like protein [Drosera capensis]